MGPFPLEAPSDWPRRKRAKALVRLAQEHDFEKALHHFVLSSYGSEVWSLNDEQLAEAEATIVSMVTFLAHRIDGQRTCH